MICNLLVSLLMSLSLSFGAEQINNYLWCYPSVLLAFAGKREV